MARPANTGGNNNNNNPPQGQNLQDLARQIALMNEHNETLQRRIEAEKRLAEELGLSTKAKEKSIQLLEAQIDGMKQQIQDALEFKTIGKTLAEMKSRQNNLTAEELTLYYELEERQEKIKDLTGQQIQQIKEEIKQKEFQTGKEELLLKALKAKDTVMNAVINVGYKMIDMTNEATKMFDEQRSSLAAVATAGMNYARTMNLAMQSSTAAGLSFKAAAEGLIDLARSFNDVALLAQSQQIELSQLTAQFKRFGVDATASLNTATLVMGMSASEAKDLTMQLFAVGDALGPRMRATINKDFGPAMSTLAAYTNKRAIAVFQKLAAQAQATGMQIGELLTVAAQFDTYEGAAEAVGRLNSMLGGDYLNSIQMLKATEDERIDLMRQSISMSGRNFSDLDRFQKKAVAAAVGITDMAKAMQVFGTEQEKLDALQKKADKAGISVEQLKERMRATQTITERFGIILQSLAVVFGPLVEGIGVVLGYLGRLVTKLGPTLTKVVIGLIAAFVAFKTSGLMAIAAGVTAVVSALSALIEKFFGLNDAITKPHSPILFIMLGVILPAAFLLLAGVTKVAAMAISAFGVAASQMGKGLQELGVGLVSLQKAIVSMGFLGFTGLLFDLGRLALVGVGMGPAAMGIMALASAIHSLATAFQALSNVDQEIIANSAKIFEKMAQITPINAVSTSAILDDFKNTMVTIRNEAIRTEDIKRKFEITVTHNNVRATNESIQGLGKQMAKQFDTFS